MMHPNKDNLMIFAIGAATGATVALLTTPKSGQEARQALRRGVDDMVTRGKDRVEGAVNTVREAAHRQGEGVKEPEHVVKAAQTRMSAD